MRYQEASRITGGCSYRVGLLSVLAFFWTCRCCFLVGRGGGGGVGLKTLMGRFVSSLGQPSHFSWLLEYSARGHRVWAKEWRPCVQWAHGSFSKLSASLFPLLIIILAILPDPMQLRSLQGVCKHLRFYGLLIWSLILFKGF